MKYTNGWDKKEVDRLTEEEKDDLTFRITTEHPPPTDVILTFFCIGNKNQNNKIKDYTGKFGYWMGFVSSHDGRYYPTHGRVKDNPKHG